MRRRLGLRRMPPEPEPPKSISPYDLEVIVARWLPLLIQADSLCSLILHRESANLPPQTKRDLERLCIDLRNETANG